MLDSTTSVTLEPPKLFPAYGQIAAALAKAQAAFPAVPKDRTVTIRSEKGNYEFSYAPLDTILSAVRKPLADNGLAITQVLDGADLHTYLLHESGEFLHGTIPVPRGGTIQALGSTITYLRRYALQAILGVAAEADDDGQAGAASGQDRAGPNPGVSAAVSARLRDTGSQTAPASGPVAVPPAAVSGEAKTGAPETLLRPPAEDGPLPDDGEPVVGAAGEPSPASTDALAAGAPADPTGLTFEEFTKMAREKGILSGLATRAARELFPDREFRVREDIRDYLNDAERTAVMFKAIDLLP